MEASVTQAVLDPQHWEEQYRRGTQVWDTGRPASELQRVLAEYPISAGRALELGCGTGTSAIWLATQGFNVTGVDLSEIAIREAERRARAARVTIDFRVGDLTEEGFIEGPFDFFFDGGCYHAVRLADREGYFRAILRATRPDSIGLVLMGNADEPEDPAGPPVVKEASVRAEWGRWFDILQLRPFRFDSRREGDKRFLGWSCLIKKCARRSTH